MTPPVRFPADASTNPFLVAHSSLGLPDPETEQLVTRGIYIDHINSETATLLRCIAPISMGGEGKTGDDCGADGVTSYLEIFPFFDVQLTWLSWWEENVGGNPVTVSNEALEDDNAHSRGFAETTSTLPSDIIANSWIHRGNVGISVTDPIDHLYYSNGPASYPQFLEANGGGPPSAGGGIEFSGTIGSAVDGVLASGTTFAGSTGVSCSLFATVFTCTIDLSALPPRTLTISGYWKDAVTDLWICEISGTYPGGDYIQTDPKSTTFDLSLVTADTSDVKFTISDSVCL
jgi:hypothetical protein